MPTVAAILLTHFYLLAGGTLAAAIASLLLLRAGRHRCAVASDHPQCRACGYDLFRLEAGQCPECGADLAQPKAIARAPGRRRALWAAGVALGVAALVVVPLTVRMANLAWAIDANRPTWWWTRQLADADQNEQARAFAELDRRALTGDLSAGQWGAIVDHLLRWQGDPALPWQPAWGDFVQRARDAGGASDAQWATYARQAPVLKLDHRLTIRRGEPLPAYIWSMYDRVGSDSPFAARFKVSEARFGGQVIPVDDWAQEYSLSSTGGVGTSWQLEMPTAATAPLADGEHELSITFDVEVMPSTARSARARPDAPPLAHTRRTVTVPVTLAAADAEVVREIRSRALDAEVAALLRVTSAERSDGVLRVNFESRGLSADLAAGVVIRVDGRESKAGLLAIRKGPDTDSAWVRMSPDLEPGARIDVILRGSAKAAARTLTMTHVWAGEHVFHDVPVTLRKR